MPREMFPVASVAVSCYSIFPMYVVLLISDFIGRTPTLLSASISRNPLAANSLQLAYFLLPTGVRMLPPPAVCVCVTPRLIMSCSSSAFEERDSAMSSVMVFAR